MADTPHFSLPFVASGSTFATVEQDSDEDIGACVYVIAATPVGSLIDQPDLGIEDRTFEQMGADLSAEDISEAIEEWEPRADATTVASIDGLTERVSLTWKDNA